MTSERSLGRAVGLLLMVQLVTGLILPYVLLMPLSAPADAFLDLGARMAGLVRLSVLMLFVGSAASLAVAIAVWPMVRGPHHQIGLWMLALAVMNCALQLVENAQWLSLLSISQAYAGSSGTDLQILEAVAPLAYASFKWAHYSHILIVVGWLFALYLLLFRSALVPRSIAAFGMLAAMLHFIGITLPAFGGYQMPFPDLFGAPLALSSIVLSLWLMVKGFSVRFQQAIAD